MELCNVHIHNVPTYIFRTTDVPFTTPDPSHPRPYLLSPHYLPSTHTSPSRSSSSSSSKDPYTSTYLNSIPSTRLSPSVHHASSCPNQLHIHTCMYLPSTQ